MRAICYLFAIVFFCLVVDALPVLAPRYPLSKRGREVVPPPRAASQPDVLNRIANTFRSAFGAPEKLPMEDEKPTYWAMKANYMDAPDKLLLQMEQKFKSVVHREHYIDPTTGRVNKQGASWVRDVLTTGNVNQLTFLEA